MTLAFKVATKMLHATRCLNMVIIPHHSCEKVVKFDFKSQSYGPETILLKGHTVTLTFKVATQMLSQHGDHLCEFCLNRPSKNDVLGRT